MSASNSSRKLTTSEIQAVGSILRDKEAIELLKQINDNIVTDEDTKGKRKQNDIFAFVGFAHQDDVLGEDPESKEYQEKQGSLRRLVDTGLILEGFHVPLERKSEKKFGDVRMSNTDDRIGKFKLTEEGLTVLSLVGSGKEEEQQQQQQAAPSPKAAKPAAATTAETNKKEKAIEAFKEDIREENKEEEES